MLRATLCPAYLSSPRHASQAALTLTYLSVRHIAGYTRGSSSSRGPLQCSPSCGPVAFPRCLDRTLEAQGAGASRPAPRPLVRYDRPSSLTIGAARTHLVRAFGWDAPSSTLLTHRVGLYACIAWSWKLKRYYIKLSSHYTYYKDISSGDL